MRLLLLLPLLLLFGCITPSAVERLDQYIYDTEKVELFDCRAIKQAAEFVAWIKDTNTLIVTLAEDKGLGLGFDYYPPSMVVHVLTQENEEYLRQSKFSFYRINKEQGILEYQKVGLINRFVGCPKIDYVPSIFFNEEFQETFDSYLKELIVERD